MIISAGLVLLKDNKTKVLLAHPTNSKWTGTYQFSKGKVDNGESILNAAIRETKEEIGVSVPLELIDTSNEYVIEYRKNKASTPYKVVHYYVADVSTLNLPDVLPKQMLEIQEMDYAAFYTKQDAETFIFHRHKTILNHLN